MKRFTNEQESNKGKQGTALNVACSGWDIHPWDVRFEKQRLVVSAKLNKEPIIAEDYCGKPLGELYNSDPRNIEKFHEGLEAELNFKNEMRYWYLLDFF